MRLHVWTDLAPPRQAQAILTATMHDAGIRCVDMTLGLLRFQLYSMHTCSGTLFLSFEVRACCDSAVDFTGRKVVSVVVIFKIEVACDFYVPKQRISASWGVCRLFGCSRKAPSAALRLLAHDWSCIAARNQTFASYLSLKLSVLPLQADLSWKVLVVSNHALLDMLKSFLQPKKQSLPDVRLHVGSSTDRWIRKC